MCRRIVAELLALADPRHLDLQAFVYAPVAACTLQAVRTSVYGWDTNLRKFGEVGESMPDLQRRNILLKLVPKEVAGPLVMHLKDGRAFGSRRARWTRWTC